MLHPLFGTALNRKALCLRIAALVLVLAALLLLPLDIPVARASPAVPCSHSNSHMTPRHTARSKPLAARPHVFKENRSSFRPKQLRVLSLPVTRIGRRALRSWTMAWTALFLLPARCFRQSLRRWLFSQCWLDSGKSYRQVGRHFLDPAWFRLER